MTYKEFTECARPEIIDELYIGGVYGCPYSTRFKDGARLLSFNCHTSEMQPDCGECWNTTMDANETARAIEVYGSEWYLSALAYTMKTHKTEKVE